jgi:hypothetical protein
MLGLFTLVPFRNYGQVLILNAGSGYHVVLAGMDRISVNVGQFVLTGGACGCHDWWRSGQRFAGDGNPGYPETSR